MNSENTNTRVKAKLSPIKQIMCIICHTKLDITTLKHTCTTRIEGQKLIVQGVQF